MRKGGWPLDVALVAIAWLAFASPWLIFGQVIPWDAKDYYYPVLRALAAALHDGSTGFWDPWLRAGNAAVADPQSWNFTPIFRLVAALDPAPSMRLIDTIQLLHLLAGGLGVLALCRALGQGPTAALLAALVFMFGGAAASRLQHSLMTVSYAYLPWALLLLRQVFAEPRASRRLAASAAFGLVAGLMAVDRDQVAFLNCLLLIVAAVWMAVACIRSQGRSAAAGRLLALAPAVIVGIALLAVPALLTLDILGRSTRAGIDLATTGRASIEPAALLTLAIPNLFNALDPAGYWGPGTWPWFKPSAAGIVNDPTTSYFYFGLVPLALLVLALLAPAARRYFLRSPLIGLFAIGLGFALLYGLGTFTPVFEALYRYLPGVSLYRRPNDAAFLFNAMAALCVGAAAQALFATAPPAGAAPRRPQVPAPSLAILVLLGTAVGALALALGMQFGHPAQAAASAALAILAISAICAALIRWPRAAASSPVWLALLLVTAIDLVSHNSGSQLNARPEQDIAAYRAEGAQLASEIRSVLADAGGPYRAEIFGLDRTPGRDGGGSWQNAALAYGIEQTLGYNSLLRNDYSRYVGAEQNSNEPIRRLTAAFTGYDSPLARLLGIRLVVTGRPIETICPPSAREGLRFIRERHGAYLYYNPSALPRVLLVPRAIAGDGATLPSDPRLLVHIEGLPAEGVATAGEGPPGTAEIVSYHSDAVGIATHMSRAGWLVLNDRFSPGWRASIDDEETVIYRANHLFRAIYLPAGEHRVAFQFQPLGPQNLIRIAREALARAAGAGEASAPAR